MVRVISAKISESLYAEVMKIVTKTGKNRNTIMREAIEMYLLEQGWKPSNAEEALKLVWNSSKIDVAYRTGTIERLFRIERGALK